MTSNAILSDKERAIFAAIAATPQLAGTVLENIDRLLATIGSEGVPVSPKTSEFAIARLPELNACLVEPAMHERYFFLLDFWWSDASDGQFRKGCRANEMANYRYKLLKRLSLKGERFDEKADATIPTLISSA